MKKTIIAAIIAISVISCSKDDTNPVPGTFCDGKSGTKTGAVCKDGTTTTSTGSGTCSAHGGVDHWLCQ